MSEGLCFSFVGVAEGRGEAEDSGQRSWAVQTETQQLWVEGRGQVEESRDSVLPEATQICIRGGRVEGRGCWWQETEQGKLCAH